MFTRQLCRASQPARVGVRRYATDGAPKSGTSPVVWVAALAAVGGGAYYWQSSSASPLATKATGNKAFKGGDQGFIDLKLEAVEAYNHNTKKLRFALPDKGDVSGMTVASALLTKHQQPGEEKPTMRPYTPISDEGDVGHMDLLVKQYPNGPMSTHLHELKPGDTLSIKGPLPKYQLTPNKHDHVGLIAGGTGITPMYQLCRAIFNNPEDKTKVTLVFANVTKEDILLKEEFDRLENTYPQRFRVFYQLDKPPEGWKGGSGFVTKELLKTVLPEPKEDNIKLFVCGPPGMYNAVSGSKKSPQDQGDLAGFLKDLGYSKDQVYKF